MAEVTTVQMSPVVTKPKASVFRWFRRILSLLSLIFTVVILFMVFIGMRDTMKLTTKASTDLCKSDAYCLDMQATYDKGFAVWEARKGIPLSFSITTEGHKDGDKLRIVCPVAYSDGDNVTIAKLKFLFQRNEEVKKCQVTKA